MFKIHHSYLCRLLAVVSRVSGLERHLPEDPQDGGGRLVGVAGRQRGRAVAREHRRPAAGGHQGTDLSGQGIEAPRRAPGHSAGRRAE